VTEKIQRANLNGTEVEDLVVGLDNPTSIALDPLEGKMYWTDSEAFGQINRIERADLNGLNQEVVVSGIGFPWGIAVLVPEPTTAALAFSATLCLAYRRRRFLRSE